MPQDIRELGKKVKAKYPGQYDDLSDEDLGRKVKARFPGAYDDFTDTQQPQGSYLDKLGHNIGLAASQGYESLKNKAAAASELFGGIATGDFRPAIEAAQLAGRGAVNLAGYIAAGAPADPALAEIEQRQAERRVASGDVSFQRRAQEMARLEAEAMAFDPSRSGRLTRGIVREGIKLAPTVITGALSGGSIPAIAGATALSSLDEPQNLAAATALSALPLPSARAAIAKVLGRGAQVAEREAVGVGQQMLLPGMEGIAKAAQRGPWQDTVLAYYRANLLTNPAGRAADLGSTVINQFADAAARPIAAAVDVAVSKLTGARSITGPSLRGTARALGSVRQGLKDAAEVMRSGRQAIESGAEGAYGTEMRSGLGKVADIPINGVFRILGALDAPFRRFGFARNLYDRAKVAALNEARQDIIPQSYLTQRIQQLLDDPGIIAAAVRDGEKAVLSEPNRISSWLAMQTSSSPNARLAIGLVQPFMRIPLNAVAKAADFSGLGGVKAMYKIARGVGRKARGQSFFRDIEEQRVFSQNVAAGSFAPAAFILGMELEERGKMIGYFLASKKHYTNSNVPTSVNIGGQNYDINRLGGFIAAPLFIGATYNRLRKQDASKANALLRSFSGLVQTAPALGYYGVPAKAGRLLTTDEPTNEILKEAGSTVAGFIPASGAMGFAAKAIDSEQRRQAEGFTGPILNHIPGLRQRLPVKETRRGRK